MTTAETTGAAAPPSAATHAGRRHEAEQGGTLTGTWTLVRFILRRDRVRLPVWIVGIVLARAVDGRQRRGPLPHPGRPRHRGRDRVRQRRPHRPPGPRLRPRHAGRPDRVQHGRLRLRRRGAHGHVPRRAGTPGPTRRRAAPSCCGPRCSGATRPSPPCSWSPTAAFAVLGALIALSLHEPGPAHRGVGRLRGGDGRVRPVVRRRHRGDRAGHRAQPHRARHGRAPCSARRTSSGPIGDIGDGTLSWLSPMGWAMAVPAVRRRAPVDAAAARRGDAGAASASPTRCWASATSAAAWCRPGPGPPAPSTALTRPLGLAVRLQRGSLLGWAAALALTGVAYGSVGKDVGDLIGDNQAMEDIIAQAGGSLTDSFFDTSLLMMALITGRLRRVVGAAPAQRGDGRPGRAAARHRACPAPGGRRRTSPSPSPARR